MKDRKDVLFYFKNTLQKFYFEKYWEYRLYANKIALEAYKEIKNNLVNLQVDSNANMETNYKQLSMSYFEIKELANYKIISKLNSLTSTLFEEWEKSQRKYQKGLSTLRDEKQLIQANIEVSKLKGLLQRSIETQKLSAKLIELEKKLSNLKNGHLSRIKKVQSQIRAIKRNLYLERKMLRDKKWSTKTFKSWNYYLFLIEINKTFSKILGFLRRQKNLEINSDEIYENIHGEYMQRFQSSFLDNSPEVVSKIKKRFLETEEIEILKKYFITNNPKFKEYKEEFARKVNDIANCKKQLNTLESNDKKRNIYYLKNNLVLAEEKAKKMKQIFEKNLKGYKTNFEIKLKNFNQKNKENVDQKILEIFTLKKETQKMLKEKFLEIQKNSKLDDKFSQSKRIQKKHFKNLLKKELTSNDDLEVEIKLIYKGLNKARILYGVNGKTIHFGNKGRFIKELLKQEVLKTLEAVGLSKSYAYKYPHEFSGGMRQRVGIARALISNPKLIIADEPIAALDLSIQAQIVNLLMDLKKQRNLSMIFIAHDLSMVEYNSDYVLIMHLGKIVEYGKTEKIFDKPIHPYTRNLMEAIPNFTNIKEKFKENHFYPDYLNEYSVFNPPQYFKINTEHYVFGTHKQFKLWTKQVK